MVRAAVDFFRGACPFFAVGFFWLVDADGLFFLVVLLADELDVATSGLRRRRGLGR